MNDGCCCVFLTPDQLYSLLEDRLVLESALYPPRQLIDQTFLKAIVTQSSVSALHMFSQLAAQNVDL